MKKNPKVDLKLKYKKNIELGLIISLILNIVLLQGFKKFEARKVRRSVNLGIITVEEIPQTQQEKKASAPSRPSVPIASEDEDIPEDETIDETIFDEFTEFEEPPPPPEISEDEIPEFIAFDKRPEPIGGQAAILKNLVYPQVAQRAGITGTVVVRALIDEKGNVVMAKALNELEMCTEAAVEAIKKTKFYPALQRDRPVKATISIPVVFQLK